MIVSEVVTPNLVTVTLDDTLSYTASLLREYGFHHYLPVGRANAAQSAWFANQQQRNAPLVLEGMFIASDIELVMARYEPGSGEQPWRLALQMRYKTGENYHRGITVASDNAHVIMGTD